MPIVAAKCTNCGASLQVDNTKEAAVCPYCGTPYIVEKAINNYNTTNNISANVVNIYGENNSESILKRAFLFLEDRRWEEADNYCEKVLDRDPENALAYLGKLMSELKVCHHEDLSKLRIPFENRSNYQKAIRFGDDDLVSMLRSYLADVKDSVYDKAEHIMLHADNQYEYEEAAELFRSIHGYKDADKKANTCLVKAQELAVKAHELAEKNNRKKYLLSSLGILLIIISLLGTFLVLVFDSFFVIIVCLMVLVIGIVLKIYSEL